MFIFIAIFISLLALRPFSFLKGGKSFFQFHELDEAKGNKDSFSKAFLSSLSLVRSVDDDV
jgi:hypothetical protein